MQAVRAIQEVELPDIIPPTIDAFGPVLLRNKAAIEVIPRKTFKYGSTDRHQLDVFYPPAPSDAAKTAPILFFCYGGGFTSGDRSLPGPYESVIYRNVGTYFASKGFITVIPDYRLVPNVQFPEASEDIRDAVLWIVQDPATYKSAEGPEPDVDNLILMGHSAGAVHTAVLMFYPPVLAVTPYLRGHIKAIVLSGALYHFDIPSLSPSVLAQYFGEGEQKEQRAVLNLLKNAPLTLLKGLPQIIMVESGRDTKAMQVSGAEFRPVLAERMKEVGGGAGGWTEAPWIVAKEHNHLSLNWALMSGEGEEWAEELVNALKKL